MGRSLPVMIGLWAKSVANRWLGRLQMSAQVSADLHVSADLENWLQPAACSASLHTPVTQGRHAS